MLVDNKINSFIITHYFMRKRLYFSIFSLSLLLLASTFDANAQGCVAVRNMSSWSFGADTVRSNEWQFSLNYRYFRSYKHFRGSDEEEHRVEEGSEVINNDNSLLFGITYSINNRWYVSAVLPYLNIDRSSLYEHYGNPTPSNPTINPRFHTQARGIGDIRLSAYYSALQKQKINLTFGLGVKLPTGNYETKDHFHKKNSEGQDSLVYKVVDQSIQLGDGGFGFMLEFDLSYSFSHRWGAYASGLYLFNPRNTNGILRSDNLTNGIAKSNEFSVVDQFVFRAGARYSIKGFQIGLGARYEGIPSEDLIGESEGFRRPGYIISLEPSVSYTSGKHTLGVNVPIALYRNRVQNTIDKERTEITGTYQIGDAAFADWLLSVTYAYRLAR
jgi:hypothetical protein